jgi:hypothetical protein
VVFSLDYSRKGSVNVRLEVTMPESIAERLATLPALNKAALCVLWKQLFNASPPAQLRKNLMISILAYRIQEQAHGPLSTAMRGRLRQLGRALDDDSDCVVPSVPTLKAGTRLVRQWRDQVHLVNVKTNGYEYQGAQYKSLSEIARLITGTRWSGPLFFGIKDDKSSTISKEAQ